MPIISGVRDKYNVNDIVNLNCSTTALNAHLSWFINGKKVRYFFDKKFQVLNFYFKMNSSHLIKYPDNEKRETIVGIRFIMEKKHFQTEEIELQCSAFCIKTIADFQEQIIIRTFNSDYLLSHSSSCSASILIQSNFIFSSFLFILIFLIE